MKEMRNSWFSAWGSEFIHDLQQGWKMLPSFGSNIWNQSLRQMFQVMPSSGRAAMTSTSICSEKRTQKKLWQWGDIKHESSDQWTYQPLSEHQLASNLSGLLPATLVAHLNETFPETAAQQEQAAPLMHQDMFGMLLYNACKSYYPALEFPNDLLFSNKEKKYSEQWWWWWW